MKKITFFMVLVIIISLLLFLPTSIYAKQVQGTDGSGTSGTVSSSGGGINTGNFKPKGLTTSDYQEAFNLGKVIITAIRSVGIVVAVGGIIILGIKYMIGSLEEKVNYKKTMLPFVIGCILIFAITQIVALLYDVVSTIEA